MNKHNNRATPLTAEENKRQDESCYFIVDHSAVDEKRILEDGGGNTLMFYTADNAKRYIIEQALRPETDYQIIKEYF